MYSVHCKTYILGPKESWPAVVSVPALHVRTIASTFSRSCLRKLTSIYAPIWYLDVTSLYWAMIFPKCWAPTCSCILLRLTIALLVPPSMLLMLMTPVILGWEDDPWGGAASGRFRIREWPQLVGGACCRRPPWWPPQWWEGCQSAWPASRPPIITTCSVT